MLLNKTAKQKINILEVKKAIYYARKYHGFQLRQSGEPYYSHPLEVAYQIADHIFKTDILVTSILHDVLEDTVFTKEMIQDLFSVTIAEQVECLTRIKLDRKISSGELVELLWKQKKEDLLLIKYFDRLHNIQTVWAKPLEKIFKIVRETFKEFISLGIYFEASIPSLINANETLLKLCYQQLSVKRHLRLNLVNSSENTFQLPPLNLQNEKFQT